MRGGIPPSEPKSWDNSRDEDAAIAATALLANQLRLS